MAKQYRDKIFFLYDSMNYIYQEDAVYFDEDEYDPRGYTIINPGKQDEIGICTLKPIYK